MSEDVAGGRAVFELVGDATQFTAAVSGAETAAAQFERAAAGSFDRTAQALAGAGKSAAAGADQLDAAGRRFVASLERQHAQLTLSREDYLRMQAAAKGVPEAVYDPLIRKLVEAEAAAKRMGGATPTAAQGLQQIGVSAAQTTAAMRQLPAQITDIFTGLTSGQAPLTVLIQQGGQIKDSFGGIGNAARALIGAITPAGLALGVVGAAAGAAAAAFVAGARDSVAFQQAIVASGNAAGLTEGKFNAMASSVAAATKTSIGSARDVLQQLVASGRFSEDALASAAKAVQVVSKATGKEASDILSTFVGLADGVSAGVESLNRQYHFLSAAQLKAIRDMEAQGETQRAMVLAFDALTGRIDAQAQAAKGLAGWWDEAKRAISGYIDAAKSIGRGRTIDDEVKRQEAYLNTLRAAKKNGGAGTADGLTYRDALAVDRRETTLDGLIARQEKLVARLKESKGVGEDIARNTAKAAQAEKDRDAANRMVEGSMSAQARLAKEMADAAAKLARGGITGEDAARVVNDIVQKSDAMQQAWAAAGASAGAAFALVTGRIAGEIDQIQSRVRQGLIDPISAISQLGAKDIERLQAERQELEANLAIARQKRENDAQVLQIQGQIAAKQQEITNRQQAVRNAIAEQVAGVKRAADAMLRDDAETIKKNVSEQQDREVANYVRLRDGIDDYRQSLADAVRMQDAEVALLGKSDAERVKTLAVLKAEMVLRDQLKQIGKQPDLRPEDRKDLENKAHAAFEAAKKDAAQLANDAALKSLYDFLDPARAQTFGEALTDAFGRSGDALSKLSSSLQAYGRNEAQMAKQRQSLEFITDPDKKLAASAALHRKEQEASIALYGDMAGAAKGFFGEGTRGYKAMEAAETAFRAFQLASDLVKGVSAAAVGIANQAQGDPYSAFPRMAAMAAAMATLGFATGFLGSSNNSSVATAAGRQGGAATGTVVTADQLDPMSASYVRGTVLGDATARSESIAKSIEALKNSAEVQLRYTSGMLASLRNIDASMSGLAALLVRTAGGGITTGKNLGIYEGTLSVNKGDPILNALGANEVFGIDASKALNIFGSLGFVKDLQGLWGKTKQSIVDSGLSVLGTVSDLTAGRGVQQFADVSTTTSSWFGLKKSTSTSTVFGPVKDEIARQFGLIFGDIGTSIKDAAGALGAAKEDIAKSVADFYVDIGMLSLKDLKGQDLQDAISAAIGAQADKIASAALPGLDAFQRVGEGYYETLTRVASGVEVAAAQLDLLGIATVSYTDVVQKQGDVAAEITRQAIDAVETAGGVLSGVGQIISVFDGTSAELAGTYRALVGVRDQLINVGISGAALTTTMIRGAGGIDQLSTSVNSYFEHFFSGTERQAAQVGALGRELGKLGIDVLPQTRDAFRALVGAQDDSTEAGQKLIAQLLGLSSAFDELFSGMEAIQSKRTDLEIQLMRAQGDEIGAVARERQRELDALAALDPALAKLQQQIYDTADAATAAAAEKAKADLWASKPNSTITSMNMLESGAQAILGWLDLSNFKRGIDVFQPGALGSGISVPQNWLDHLAAGDAGWSREFVDQSAAYWKRALELSSDRMNKAVDPTYEALMQRLNSGQAPEQSNLAQQQLDATRSLISTLDSLEASLDDFGRSLLVGDLSVLSPEQQYAQAKSALDSVVAQARTGDVASIQSFESVARTLLEISKSFNGGGGMFVADTQLVQRENSELIELMKRIEANTGMNVRTTAAAGAATASALADGNALTEQSIAYQALARSRNVG